MAETAIHPPVHLNTNPDEPVRSFRRKPARFVRGHTDEGTRSESVLHKIEGAGTEAQAIAAADASAWTRKRAAADPAKAGRMKPDCRIG